MHIGQEMTALFDLLMMFVILDVLDAQVLMLMIVLRVLNTQLVTPMGTVAVKHTGHLKTAHSLWVTVTQNVTAVMVPMLAIV